MVAVEFYRESQALSSLSSLSFASFSVACSPHTPTLDSYQLLRYYIVRVTDNHDGGGGGGGNRGDNKITVAAAVAAVHKANVQGRQPSRPP